MARDAVTPLPEDDYLTLIGQVAYMVSSLEWTVLGDLPGLRQYLPSDLTASVLAGKSTGQIAGRLSKAVDAISDDDVRVFVERAAQLLGEAAAMRNDLLHARPATIGEHQRLFRWKPGRALPIDIAWLNNTIDKLSAAERALSDVRPIHKNAAFGNR